jgi:DNA/RNA endonuclease YhcR with UshA esterase domain
MKFKYLIILIAIASLVALYLLSIVSHPVLISLSKLSTYNGQKVVVQGIVTEYRTTSYGSQIITIKERENSTNSVMLYIEGAIPVEYGDVVQATGQIQQYKEQWEVVVNNPHFILILQKWNNLSFPLWQLAQHPENYLDTNVNVTGVATQTYASSFVLSSTDGTYSIEVSYLSSCSHQFSKGDAVAVGARFVYNEATFQFSLRAVDDTHGIWKIER